MATIEAQIAAVQAEIASLGEHIPEEPTYVSHRRLRLEAKDSELRRQLRDALSGRLRARQKMALRNELVSVFVAVLSVSAALALFALGDRETIARGIGAGPLIDFRSRDREEAQAVRFETLEAKISQLEKALEQRPPVSSENALTAEVLSLREGLNQSAARITAFESAISTDIERALSVPILRKDTELLTSRVDELALRVESIGGTVSMIFNLAIGGLFTLAAFNIAHLFRGRIRRKKPAEALPEAE